MINIDQRRRENRTEEQRKAQTAAAIASRKNLPPARERSLQNQLKVFDWIYKWGYSSSPIIQQLLEKKSSNFTTVGGDSKKLAHQISHPVGHAQFLLHPITSLVRYSNNT